MILTASTLVGIATYEGYKDKAYIPIPGDVATIGFGETEGVKLGDKTNPVRSLQNLLEKVETVYGAGVKKCITVPLHPYEYEAFVSLTYNIGIGAFCSSTLVKKANAGDYTGACMEILRWDKAGGKVVNGLTLRREKEYKTCIGGDVTPPYVKMIVPLGEQ